MQQGIHNGLQMFIKNTYTPVLEWALKNRATTISIAISTFILSLGIVASGFLKFNFFPPLEADIVIATVQIEIVGQNVAVKMIAASQEISITNAVCDISSIATFKSVRQKWVADVMRMIQIKHVLQIGVVLLLHRSRR